MKRVLITGKDSYIGTSFISWVKEKHPGEFETEELDMIDGTWKEKDFPDMMPFSCGRTGPCGCRACICGDKSVLLQDQPGSGN